MSDPRTLPILLGSSTDQRFEAYLAMVSHNDSIIPLEARPSIPGSVRGVWFLGRGVRIVQGYASYSDVICRYWTVEVNDDDDGAGGSGSWEEYPTASIANGTNFNDALAVAIDLMVTQSTTQEQA